MSEKARRTIDRDRRQRIVQAAVELMMEQGVATLSHRRAATAAGVPLSATTYYFASLDELICAAFQLLVDREMTRVQARFGALPPEADLVPTLTQLICEAIDDNRRSSVLSIELYAVAVRSDSIRQVALEWNAMWMAELEPRIGHSRAMAVVGVATWLIQQALLERIAATGEASRAYVEAVLATCLRSEEN